jgi:hypothetical protein
MNKLSREYPQNKAFLTDEQERASRLARDADSETKMDLELEGRLRDLGQMIATWREALTKFDPSSDRYVELKEKIEATSLKRDELIQKRKALRDLTPSED